MDKKIVLVTGGASGIGLGIIEYLISQNNYIIISMSKGTNHINQVKEKSGLDEVLFVQGDVTNQNDCNRIFNIINEKYGKLDGLINSAGIVRRGGIEEQTLDEWNESLNTNLTSIFLLVKTLLPLLKKGSNPSIINISSISSKIPSGSISYATSKAGVDMITKYLAKDLAKYNIRVNAINPGTIYTNIDISAGSFTVEEYTARLEAKKNDYPLKRLGDAKNDIGPMAELLLSDKSLWTTGSLIFIDGGKTI